ncbi:4a-hydroxytetrahydrobiopterin dehydratase [Flavobacterium sp. RSB2_4_14]|uniref:4a-hydroxytetrahydrobiopterin dehydratase n=1 Tax=Flavobacterium sp. RSB2_4_14 TaxID=3447665 RepID=UPI003F2F6D67
MSWIIKNGKLVNTFEFKSQTELATFLVKIAKYADEIHHHPDYEVFQCSKVTFSLFTHDKNGITELDYKLSDFISSQFSLDV